MSLAISAISALIGALIGGLAAIGGAWLQDRSARELRREEIAEQENQRRQRLARDYLYQLRDAVESLRERAHNWAYRGGPQWANSKYPGYWELTSLYVFARALGAERLMALEGVYVDLQSVSPKVARPLEERAVEDAVRAAFHDVLFYYHRLLLAEALLDRVGTEFRLLTYFEFVRTYEDSGSKLMTRLEPVRHAFGSLSEERLVNLERSLVSLRTTIEALLGSPHDGRAQDASKRLHATQGAGAVVSDRAKPH